MNEKKKSNWLLWVLLVFLPPIGIIYLWVTKKGFTTKKKIIITIVFALWFFICFAINGNSSNNTKQVKPVSTEIPVTETQAESKTEAISTEVANDTTETATVEASTENASIPTEYKSALNKAKTYGDVMHMSKAGIYNQLTSEYGEKFTPEAAQYAIDNVEVDWNANALIKAKTYSDTMYMSKAGIYDQLISENGEIFTPEEAQYAIDHVEVDWNANALEKAKTYQESMSMSPAAIHDQLTSEHGEKFTQEEADYAIANLN
nr:Ltp family lipoprotein [uncultured Clostridium sp.]